MELTILTKKENPYLGRQEIKGRISFTGATPSNQKVIEALTQQLKVSPEVIVLKRIITHFGQQEAELYALIYHLPANKQKFEVLTAHMKKQKEEAKKKAAEAEAQKKKEAVAPQQ